MAMTIYRSPPRPNTFEIRKKFLKEEEKEEERIWTLWKEGKVQTSTGVLLLLLLLLLFLSCSLWLWKYFLKYQRASHKAQIQQTHFYNKMQGDVPPSRYYAQVIWILNHKLEINVNHCVITIRRQFYLLFWLIINLCPIWVFFCNKLY